MTIAGGIAERAFFRDEFRRRTVVIALRPGEPASVASVVPVVRELVAGGSRVLVLADAAADASRLAEGLGVTPQVWTGSDDDLATLWCELTDTGCCLVGFEGDPAGVAASVACRLGVVKLVLTDPAGGWGRSFGSLDDLATEESARAEVQAAVRSALAGGVGGVNVCRAVDLDTELFTFDGAGTLFTADAYVRVTPLKADDLAMVEQLVSRGVADGFLRPRSRLEVVRLALGGLGARVSHSGHLAGLGALEVDRYRDAGVAEVTCLYTVNRYEGEGIGGHLVNGLVASARARDARAVFACTVSRRAAELFERSGFHSVSLDELPESKWVGYDSDRRARLSAHWIDLADDPAGPVEVAAT